METNDQDRNMEMLNEMNMKLDKIMNMMEAMNNRTTPKTKEEIQTNIEDTMRKFVEKYRTQKEKKQYKRTSEELESFNHRISALNKNLR
jgi:predicted transcriptional regulator YheO